MQFIDFIKSFLGGNQIKKIEEEIQNSNTLMLIDVFGPVNNPEIEIQFLAELTEEDIEKIKENVDLLFKNIIERESRKKEIKNEE